MPQYPHEALPEARITLAELCAEAHHLSIDPLPPGTAGSRDYHVANLMLGGRLLDEDGDTARVVVEPPESHPDGDLNLPDTAQRSFGQMTAVLKELHFSNIRLSIYPLPLRAARMQNKLGISVEVNSGVRNAKEQHIEA